MRVFTKFISTQLLLLGGLFGCNKTQTSNPDTAAVYFPKPSTSITCISSGHVSSQLSPISANVNANVFFGSQTGTVPHLDLLSSALNQRFLNVALTSSADKGAQTQFSMTLTQIGDGAAKSQASSLVLPFSLSIQLQSPANTGNIDATTGETVYIDEYTISCT